MSVPGTARRPGCRFHPGRLLAIDKHLKRYILSDQRLHHEPQDTPRRPCWRPRKLVTEPPFLRSADAGTARLTAPDQQHKITAGGDPDIPLQIRCPVASKS